MKVTTVTKTLARQLAAKPAAWYADGTHLLGGSMKCPCCEQQIHAELPRKFWGLNEHRKNLGLMKAIQAAIIEHLTNPYDDETCPHTKCWPRHDVGKPAEPS
jgi:hypothetical protein